MARIGAEFAHRAWPIVRLAVGKSKARSRKDTEGAGAAAEAVGEVMEQALGAAPIMEHRGGPADHAGAPRHQAANSVQTLTGSSVAKV
ncbi:MAG: hypothetical protein BZY87_04665 [SAR202 cluster bacterium Io17-Chloro-G6]|nr:MAG: hypothetical protein BZY87_04665 [SAR202 cluster bacterium Io17-Chloro-G6]